MTIEKQHGVVGIVPAEPTALPAWNTEEIAKANAEVATIDAISARKDVDLRGHDAKVAARRTQLIKYIAILQQGYEPTTPPAEWYCGVVVIPKGHNNQTTELTRWPHKAFSGGTDTEHQFTSPVPSAVGAAYAIAANLFGDDIRVYSPNRADFAELPRPKRVDPVMIGYLDGRYYEIIRWDVDKDLEVLFSNL